MALDKPKYGWEGISNGGEIYGTQTNSQTSYQSELEQDYIKTVERLALQKMKNDITFEGFLNSAIRRFTSLGLEVNKDDMMKDIQKEISKQSIGFGIEDDFIIDAPNENISSQIDNLKSNLGDIFGGKINFSIEQPIQSSGSIPREPAIQSRDDYQEMMSELSSSVTPVQQNQKIHEELEMKKQKISDLLERTANTLNEPTVVHLGSESQQPQNIWNDLNAIDINSEEYLDKLEKIYEIQVERLAILKSNNSPEFEAQLNFAVQNILNRTDRMPNAREQLLYDVDFYLSHSMTNSVSNKNNKDELIFNIIQYMYPNVTEYVPVNDIKRQLETYSEEKLEEMIGQYDAQIQELNSGGMHR